MANLFQIETGFFEDGVDVGTKYVTKSYILEVYPNLLPNTVAYPGLFSIGYNIDGQLGTNNLIPQSSPVQTIAGGSNWKSLSNNVNYHVSAIKTDGTLWLWGLNTDGQLGNNDRTHRSSPAQIYGGGNNWKSVSCGYSQTGAIKTDGTLWSWGLNTFGQLGTNNTTSRSSPTQIYGGGTNWKSVSCFRFQASAIKTDGTLWSWGYNMEGQLGINNTTFKSSPTQIYGGGTTWKSVSCGAYNASAIKTDGTLWSWGYNGEGQLGVNDTTPRSSPTQIYGGGTNWTSVSCGSRHTMAIKTDGTLWSWGYNTSGQLGISDLKNRSSPVQTITGGTNWKFVSGGMSHTVSIKIDGTLWSWGLNTDGQLGTNDRTDRSSPTQIYEGNNWKAIVSGAKNIYAIAETGDYFYQ